MKSINAPFDSDNTMVLPLKQAAGRSTAAEGSQLLFMLYTCDFYSALITVRLKCTFGMEEASETCTASLPQLHMAPRRGKDDCCKGRTQTEASLWLS